MSCDAREELLIRLLDAYERSASFGKPGPWPRDLIVHIDAKTFPDAYAAEGRERLESLRAAAAYLEDRGAVRCERERGLRGAHVRLLRMGATELPAAYELAGAYGYTPLAQSWQELTRWVDQLAEQPDSADFIARFLQTLSADLASFDTTRLGMRRERVKRELLDIKDALRAAVAIASGDAGWERMLSEQLFRDSKRLSALRGRVADVLKRADPRLADVESEALDVLATYGVRRRPGVIQCAGGGALRVDGGMLALESFVPCAWIPEAWSDAWVSAVLEGGVRTVTTIENEYPFYAYLEEAGGPEALARRAELVVYLGGFPARFLTSALVKLAEAAPHLDFRHWGDADAGGVRIWLFLRGALGRALPLYRTTPQWLASAAEGATRLSALDRARLCLARKAVSSEVPAGPDVEQVVALIDAMLTSDIKLEQERM